jgi:hypothetical protein
VAGWIRTWQVRSAAAVLPVLLRSSEKIALAVVPVTLTPFWARQLLKAARAEALIARLAPPPNPPKPAGAYLAQAWNAAACVPVKDGRGRADPLGKARGVKDPVGNARGEKDPLGRANRLGETVTPCCFRQVSKALSPAVDVALVVAEEEEAAAALPPPPPPQPASKNAAATAGSAARISTPRMVRARTRRLGKANSVRPFMLISSKGMT